MTGLDALLWLGNSARPEVPCGVVDIALSQAQLVTVVGSLHEQAPPVKLYWWVAFAPVTSWGLQQFGIQADPISLHHWIGRVRRRLQRRNRGSFPPLRGIHRRGRRGRGGRERARFVPFASCPQLVAFPIDHLESKLSKAGFPWREQLRYLRRWRATRTNLLRAPFVPTQARHLRYFGVHDGTRYDDISVDYLLFSIPDIQRLPCFLLSTTGMRRNVALRQVALGQTQRHGWRLSKGAHTRTRVRPGDHQGLSPLTLSLVDHCYPSRPPGTPRS
ncbi:hypothetical protein LY78DRAFT_262482 [Colletotrichum sublineola]|nr:hypothetical protein LY78DRAFT_262482 [Colletotrichum sublineola]